MNIQRVGTPVILKVNASVCHFTGHAPVNYFEGQVFVYVTLNTLSLVTLKLVSWCFEPSQPQRITSGLVVTLKSKCSCV